MTAKNIANQFDFIEFPAKDIDQLRKVRRFFSSVFDWSYKDWGDDYADTASSGINSGINADPEHRPSYPLAVIYTTDLESVREKVIAAGGIITKDIFSFPGGRRFHFKDPADNELAVWSDQENQKIGD
jgi:predicted enzyme related to lactoylglutathione lyase